MDPNIFDLYWIPGTTRPRPLQFERRDRQYKFQLLTFRENGFWGHFEDMLHSGAAGQLDQDRRIVCARRRSWPNNVPERRNHLSIYHLHELSELNVLRVMLTDN